MESSRLKIEVEKLTLRQTEGFLSVMPMDSSQFGEQFERVLPARSASNLYPLNLEGKTDNQYNKDATDAFIDKLTIEWFLVYRTFQ